MRYLSPKADLTFKKFFGEHKDMIISFLNAHNMKAEGLPVEMIARITGLVRRK